MKVLHVYRTYFPDPPGGLQEAIRQISLAARAFGVESRVFTLSRDPIPQTLVRPEGLVFRAKSWCAPASCDLGGAASLRLFCEQAAWADVLHFHFPWPYADVLNLLPVAKRPKVMTYHSDIVRQRLLLKLYTPIMQRTLKSMDAVVATSPNYLQTSPYLRSFVAESRLRTIPLGIEDHCTAPSFNEVNSDIVESLNLTGRKFVLALGVLRYYKGFHTLIEATKRISAPIVIAGSGPEELNLKKLAESFGAKNLIFAGQVTDQEKKDLLRSCTLLVLPSHLRSEAFGMVLIEASMYGKPMVCCEIGSGTSFVNTHQETGFVVPPENSACLAEAINLIIDSESLTQKFGTAARQRYENMFSGQAQGSAYYSLYKEVIAQH